MQETSEPYPTPYPELNAVLRELVHSVQAILRDSLIAAVLQGSFAVGDFDRHSDVDFIMVVEEELSDSSLDALQIMHERIFGLECEWARHLEGSYFPKDILRHYARRGSPLWYLNNGHQSLVQSNHDNTIVVRSVVRARGIALTGPSPVTLVDPVPSDVLRQEILEHMHRWGQLVLAQPDQINSRFFQTFAVLHYCRMLHDIRTGVVGSKRAGAEWAKANLDPSWRGLIDRAWDGRPNPALSSRQPADPNDLASTLEFIQYAMQASTRPFTDPSGPALRTELS